MGHSHTFQAIVLKTYDVGEADRFCILFTRERGRVAARARGVRRLMSHMGGSLLPLCHVDVQLHEGKSGWLVTGAKPRSDTLRGDIHSFVVAEQGLELLLKLLHEDEPLPDVFELTKEFAAEHRSQQSVLPFAARLLTLLGILSPELDRLSEEERAFLQTCGSNWATMPTDKKHQRLLERCLRIVEEQTSSSLRTHGGMLAFA